MADYFTNFSVMFSPGSANVAQAMAIYNEMSTSDDEDRHISFGLDQQGDDLWIYDDGSDDMNGVIKFVTACAKEFALKGRWGFEYANTCSKPRTDAFGGGGAVINFYDDCKVDEIHTSTILSCWLEGNEAGA